MNLESTSLQKIFKALTGPRWIKFMQGMPDLVLEILYTVQNYLWWSIPTDSS